MVNHKYDEILKHVAKHTLSPSLLMHYLKEHYEVDGVRDFLLNQFYNAPAADLAFYIPAIV